MTADPELLPRSWSDEDKNAWIKAGRLADPPRAWGLLGDELGLPLWEVFKRAYELIDKPAQEQARAGLIAETTARVTEPEPPPPARLPHEQPRKGAGSEPLPAGHPITWGVITHGTLLEGEPYPIPHDPTLRHSRSARRA